MTVNTAETASGKGASDENFPVGSFLLPKRLRPHVAIFYAYARAIDDVADNLNLIRSEDGYIVPFSSQDEFAKLGPRLLG